MSSEDKNTYDENNTGIDISETKNSIQADIEKFLRTSMSSEPWLSYGDAGSSGDSGVDLGSEVPLSSGSKKEKAPKPKSPHRIINDKVQNCPEKMSEDNETKQSDMSLDSVKAIALLNDVLDDYPDLNESSTDDPEIADSSKKATGDFEARVASLAAGLDLSKQRRRQAPRPPSSPPPPEPPADLNKKKVPHQPDPIFKMVPVGKPIVTVPGTSGPKSSQAPLGLEEYTHETDDSSSDKGGMGDGKSKKGITSVFKSFFKRSKDSIDNLDSLNNPEVQLGVKSTDLPNSHSSSSNDSKKDFYFTLEKQKSPPTSPPLRRSISHKNESDSAISRNKSSTSLKQDYASEKENPAGSLSPSLSRSSSRGRSDTKNPIPKPTSAPPAKPYPAPKPSVPPPAKPRETSSSTVSSSNSEANSNVLSKNESALKDG